MKIEGKFLPDRYRVSWYDGNTHGVGEYPLKSWPGSVHPEDPTEGMSDETLCSLWLAKFGSEAIKTSEVVHPNFYFWVFKRLKLAGLLDHTAYGTRVFLK